LELKKLLFLGHTLPYPPDGGIWIRTYHVLRLLARAFDITALCFERVPMPGRTVHDREAGCRALQPFADVEAFPVPQYHSRVRYIWDHARSTAMQRVYTTYVYESPAFDRRLAEVLRTMAIDVIHVDSLDLARYLSGCRGIPVVCAHQDVESKLLRRRAGIERHVWRRVYVRRQARLREHTERCWCGRVALNVTVSDRDRESLARIAPGARLAIVPNGVDIEHFRPRRIAGTGIAFVGGLTWFPNLDALEFFCRDILPHLRAAGGMPIRWIGAASTAQVRRYRDAFHIDVTGYVEDVRPLMSEAACHIVPLRAGGGTRLKILNAWAMAKPVVTTSIGCEGLAAVDGDNVLIRDDPKEFAGAIVSVLADARLARRLGESGRATVERFYSWDVIGRELIQTYLDVACGVACRPPAPSLMTSGAGAHTLK